MSTGRTEARAEAELRQNQARQNQARQGRAKAGPG
jgi:hypothetical protein